MLEIDTLYFYLEVTILVYIITFIKIYLVRANNISYTLSKAKAIISSLKALDINYNTSLVLIIRTILRFKVFRIKYYSIRRSA
jgi:hypothetical protein